MKSETVNLTQSLNKQAGLFDRNLLLTNESTITDKGILTKTQKLGRIDRG